MMMLQQPLWDLNHESGIFIQYPSDGFLFNLKLLPAHMKTLEQLIHSLLFADEAALAAHTEPGH